MDWAFIMISVILFVTGAPRTLPSALQMLQASESPHMPQRVATDQGRDLLVLASLKAV
jgi:hypothetical protein